MALYQKRAMISLRPEWEPDLEKLKKEKFYNTTQAEMFRYLIRLGLNSLKNDADKMCIRDSVTTELMTEVYIVGGFLIASSGISILGLKDCKTLNMLPSLLVPVAWFVIRSLF